MVMPLIETWQLIKKREHFHHLNMLDDHEHTELDKKKREKVKSMIICLILIFLFGCDDQLI